MDTSYWLKQSSEKPLFPDILWSRPESKSGAGKLAVIGGHGHGFGAPGIAWNVANESGAGTVKVLLPDAIKKTVRYVLPDADYAPSNPSGSFAKKSLSSLLDISQWADATILAGDFGRNSETAVLLEEFVRKYQGLLTISQDAVDYFKAHPKEIIKRENTLLVMSLSQLQKFFINTPVITPITYSMTELQLADALHLYTLKESEATIITKFNDIAFIASKGRIATQNFDEKIWRVKIASRSTVFWMQNPQKLFEAVAASLYED